jgi:hypothetical protein
MLLYTYVYRNLGNCNCQILNGRNGHLNMYFFFQERDVSSSTSAFALYIEGTFLNWLLWPYVNYHTKLSPDYGACVSVQSDTDRRGPS